MTNHASSTSYPLRRLLKLVLEFGCLLLVGSQPLAAHAGLIGCWNFDEQAGTTATDCSGNNRDGALLPAPGGVLPVWIGDGIRGGALHFDGTGYVRIANSSGLNFGNNGFSLASWVRYGTLKLPAWCGYSNVVSKTLGNVGGGYFLSVGWDWYRPTRDNYPSFYYSWDGNCLLAPNAEDDQQWHYLVGTNDGNTGRFYVDGVYASSGSGSPSANSYDFMIGGIFSNTGQFANWFVGDIDEVRLYDVPLTADQIRGLYYQYTSPTPIFGYSIKTASSYEFAIARGTQQANAIYFSNVGAQPGSIASMAVANTPSDLALSVAPSGGLGVPAGLSASAILSTDATNAAAGRHDNILLKISTDDGNVLYSTIRVVVQSAAQSLPDLTVGTNDIIVASSSPNGPTTLTVNVHNAGIASASNVYVRLYDFDTLIGDHYVAQVLEGGATGVSFSTTLTSGEHVIRAVVDPDGSIAELDETNNEASTLVRINASSSTLSGILVTGSLPTTVYSGSTFTISGQAQYDLVANEVSNDNYAVKGGLVRTTLVASGSSQSLFGDIHTDTSGKFSDTVQAPAAGKYLVLLNVTDQTLTGQRQLTLSVVDTPTPGSQAPEPPPPPVEWGGSGSYAYDSSTGGWTWTWRTMPPSPPPAGVPSADVYFYSQDIHFNPDPPGTSQDITLSIQIHYWASDSTKLATNVPINFYVTPAGGTKARIGQTIIPSISIAGPDSGSRFVLRNS